MLPYCRGCYNLFPTGKAHKMPAMIHFFPPTEEGDFSKRGTRRWQTCLTQSHCGSGKCLQTCRLAPWRWWGSIRPSWCRQAHWSGTVPHWRRSWKQSACEACGWSIQSQKGNLWRDRTRGGGRMWGLHFQNKGSAPHQQYGSTAMHSLINLLMQYSDKDDAMRQYKVFVLC